MKSKVAIIGALLLTLPVSLFAWGGGCFYGPYGYGMGGRFFGGGFIMMILTVLLIGLLIFFGIRLTKINTFSESKDNSIEILKTRYAKGEISKEQFDSMKRDLKEI